MHGPLNIESVLCWSGSGTAGQLLSCCLTCWTAACQFAAGLWAVEVAGCLAGDLRMHACMCMTCSKQELQGWDCSQG